MVVGNKRLLGIGITVAILLLTPLIAMQFSNEVSWSSSDFVVAGILLLGTGLAIELTLRKVKKTSNRILLCTAILLILLLIWAELAVDIFGTLLAGS